MAATDSRGENARVAVLGTGIMGSAMARNLVSAGLRTTVWDRSPTATAPLSDAGALVAASPAEAVQDAHVVITMLPTAEVVNSVIFAGGVVGALAEGAVWAQMGTIGLTATTRIGSRLGQLRPDVLFVDAPVSGSKGPAEAGQLLILASGPPAAAAAVGPVFSAIGRKTVWLGEAGQGSRMKLVVNAYMSILIEGVAEALELAGRLGIDLVFQDADDDRLVFRGPPSCLVQRGRCADAVRGDRGQVGVVRQALQHRQSQAGRYREQQIRACLACGGEEVIAVEAAVKDDQHSLLTIGQHVLRQFAFAGADRAQFGGDDGMRAALAQSEHPQLRERATVAGPGGRTAERGLVLAGVGHVEGDSVDGHQPPAAQPGADRGWRRDRRRGPFEQSPHRLLAEALAGLAQRRGGGHVPVPFPGGDEPQPADHLSHHFFVGLAVKQR